MRDVNFFAWMRLFVCRFLGSWGVVSSRDPRGNSSRPPSRARASCERQRFYSLLPVVVQFQQLRESSWARRQFSNIFGAWVQRILALVQSPA
jgi:hypothetical protein